jgi:CPA1 family monovalent cation:H+ antiporter
VAATLTGVFSLEQAVFKFSLLALGGIAVGVAVAAVWIWIAPRLHDDLLVIASALFITWTAYFAGEGLHVSGEIATVTTGIVFGVYQDRFLSASVRIQATPFWRFIVFVLESFIFILIGLSLRSVLQRVGGLQYAFHHLLLPIAGIIAAMTLARFIWIFGADAIQATLYRTKLCHMQPLGPRAAAILSWAGMRGVVTLAIALSLPPEIPGRDFILMTAFAVILVTVVGQGTALAAFIRLFGIKETEKPHDRLSAQAAHAVIWDAQLKAIQRLSLGSNISRTQQELLEYYTRGVELSTRHASDDISSQDITARNELILRALTTARQEIRYLYQNGSIDSETRQNLEHELDIIEYSLQHALQFNAEDIG